MGSQKSSNRTDIIAILMGVPGWIALILMFYFRYYPDPTKEPDIMRPLMNGWLPIVVLITAQSLYMVGLLIVIFRRYKNKHLKAEISTLNADLTKAKSDHGAEQRARQTCVENYNRLEKESNLKINDLNNQKDAIREELRKREEWSWLTDIAGRQISSITDLVKLDYVSLGDMELSGLDPTVRYAIHFTNKSHLDISLDYEQDDLIHGQVQFSGHKTITLRGTKVVIHTAKDIPAGGSGCLTIEQRLIDNEPRVIAEGAGWPPSMFHFAGLIVNIVGGKRSPDITPAQLVMGNATCAAFNENLLEKGQRIRALAEVHGRTLQLYETLRIGDKPLSKVVIEKWQTDSIKALEKVYKTKAANRLWQQITSGYFIGITAGSQRGYLEGCFVQLGGLLADMTGEYIRRNTQNT